MASTFGAFDIVQCFTVALVHTFSYIYDVLFQCWIR